MKQTDKYDSGIIDAYEELFCEDSCLPTKYLEVGILNGGSLEWARDFFWNEDSRIFGLDIVLPDPIDGVTMEYGDQGDSEGLKRFAEREGPFDIIIDDGSHLEALTRNTFDALFPFVTDSGCYIIEDWGIGYHYDGLHTLTLGLVAEHGGVLVKLNDGPITNAPAVNGEGTFAIIGKKRWGIIR